MGWLKKRNNQETPQTEEIAPARNPDNAFIFRMLAVAYVLYLVWDIVRAYLEGGEGAPALWAVCLIAVLLGGGAICLGVISYKQWKKAKAQQVAEAEAEAEALLEEETEE